jgi:hypothetical protein
VNNEKFIRKTIKANFSVRGFIERIKKGKAVLALK